MKAPATGKGGYQVATADPDKLRALWAAARQYLTEAEIERGGDFNIGFVPASGCLTCIDLDEGHDTDWADENLPRTMTVQTPNGEHLYYVGDERFGNGDLAKNINVRDSAGYAILPPSIVDEREPKVKRGEAKGGTYRWSDTEQPAPLPEPIAAKLRGQTKERKEREPYTGDIETLGEALRKIPGEVDWKAWNDMGMALYAATEGSIEGLALFEEWSRTAESYADYTGCDEAWDRFDRSPPSSIGADYIFSRSHSPASEYDKLCALIGVVFEKPPDYASLDFWVTAKFPPVEPVLGGLLSTVSRLWMVAPTGLGKTQLGLAMAGAIAAGKDLCHWKVPKPRRVLYFDGEMQRGLMQMRVLDMIRRMDLTPEEMANLKNNFILVSREVMEGAGVAMPPLNTPEGNAFAERMIARYKPEAVFFDNVQCLLIGEMREPEAWAPVSSWVRTLTNRGIVQVWMHHTNEQGGSYGDKTREWQMSTVLTLSRCDEEEPEEGKTRFNIDTKRKAREKGVNNNWEDYREGVLEITDNGWEFFPKAKNAHIFLVLQTLQMHGTIKPVSDWDLAQLMSGRDWDTPETRSRWEMIRKWHSTPAARKAMAECGRMIGNNWFWVHPALEAQAKAEQEWKAGKVAGRVNTPEGG
jgi:hypothetical protein